MLNSSERQELKKKAQHLEPVIWVGKEGVTDRLIVSISKALADHELMKVKFSAFKDEKKKLAPLIAEKSQSELVTLVGNVAVLFKKRLENQPSQ